MKFDIEASLKPPSFEFEYEIDRDEIRAVGRNDCDRVRRGSDCSSARRTDFTLTLIHRRGRSWVTGHGLVMFSVRRSVDDASTVRSQTLKRAMNR